MEEECAEMEGIQQQQQVADDFVVRVAAAAATAAAMKPDAQPPAIKRVECKTTPAPSDPSAYVKLNVGGHLFHTTVGVLCRYDSMFRAMFAGTYSITQDEDDYVLIDRSGKHFGKILNFLRDGISPDHTTIDELAELFREAEYYLIQDLMDRCDSLLVKMKFLSICHGAGGGLTHPRILFANSDSHVKKIRKHKMDTIYIEWQINRDNALDKFEKGYAENVIKNFELFIRLFQKFKTQAVFIFNYDEGWDTCRWRVYSDGYAHYAKKGARQYSEFAVYKAITIALLHKLFCKRCLNFLRFGLKSDPAYVGITFLQLNDLTSFSTEV